jgi:hypothetical protein
MEGFEVVTSDDSKIGHVVEVRERHLIVEHGLLKKTRHAVPEELAHTSDDEQIVRLSVSKEIVESSPKLDNGSIDTQAVAEHFGLVEGADQDLLRADGSAEIREGGLDSDQEGTTTDYLSDRVPDRR